MPIKSKQTKIHKIKPYERCYVQIEWTNLTKAQADAVSKAAEILRKAGIDFDTGGFVGGVRHWEYDFSLSKNVKVLFVDGPFTDEEINSKDDDDDDDA